MITPGQQLDERHEALAAKVVELGSIGNALNVSTDKLRNDLEAISLRLANLEAGVVASDDDTVDVDPPASKPAAGSIIPGPGFVPAITVPKQIGDRHERAIAHWNVVPEQQVEDGFTVGVIAHHLDGIETVEISANGGSPVTATLGINPRTGCEEYFAPLDLTSYLGGPIKLRAVAYPIRGTPFVVKPLGGEYSKQDLTLYTEFVGEILELGAGEHNLGERPIPDKGWLIVRPKPGVARERCILVGESENWRGGRLKLEGVTMRLPEGNDAMRGQYQARSITGHHVWFDKCRIIGNGPKDTTSWIAFMWETATYTDCEISHVQTVFHGHRGIDTLARNCYIHDIYEDVSRSSGLYVGLRIEDVDREPLVVAQGLQDARSRDKPHPDLWQLGNLKNTIIQDVTATKNIKAQGLFPANVSDVAIVRLNVKTQGYRAAQIMGEVKNMLISDTIFDGGNELRGEVLPGERLVIKRTQLDEGNWTQQGVEVVR